MGSFDLYWSPEGRKIATVEAKDFKDAKRQTPKPYSKFRGEVYAVHTPNAYKAVITLESEGFLLGGARFHESTPFVSRKDGEAFGQQCVETNLDRPGYRGAKIYCEIVPVYHANPIPDSGLN